MVDEFGSECMHAGLAWKDAKARVLHHIPGSWMLLLSLAGSFFFLPLLSFFFWL